MIDTGNISFEHIINFDETSISKDCIGNRTIEFNGEKHVIVNTFGEEKKCFTIGIFSNILGTFLKGVLVWPSKGKVSKISR